MPFHRMYRRAVTKVGNDYTGKYLQMAKKQLVGYHYTQRQIDDIMVPLKSDDSSVAGIYVTNSGKTLYKFDTVPHLKLNLVELLGIEENTEEGLDRLL